MSLNSIDQKRELIFSDFAKISDQDDRYRYLIKRSKANQELTADEKLDKYLIEGCVSQVWLIPSYENKTITFKYDSDALLVKGIVALLVDFFNGMTPQELTTIDMGFLSELGIQDHLSMNRRNGLASIIKQAKLYALVYSTM